MAPSLPRPSRRTPGFRPPRALRHRDPLPAAATAFLLVRTRWIHQEQNNFPDLGHAAGYSDGFTDAPAMTTTHHLPDYHFIWAASPMPSTGYYDRTANAGWMRYGDHNIQQSFGYEPYWIPEEETVILDGSTEEENMRTFVGPPPERDNNGLSEETILKHLKTRESVEVRAEKKAGDICVVCQEDLCKENCSIGRLGCGHEFHACCVAEWLKQKNACPLCKSVALPVDGEWQ